jgi:transcriptional regulator with XRE-family HTH domain
MKAFSKVKKVVASPGQVVRAFRTSFGITLKELEEVTGISQTNLSAIENDRLDIGVRRTIRIAAAFGIDPEQILFPEGYRRDEDDEAERIRARAERLFQRKAVRGR